MSEENALAGQSRTVGNPQPTNKWIGNPGDLTNQVFAIPALQCCKASSFRILSGIEPLHVEDFGTADALEYEVAAFFFALADNDICRVIAKFQAAFFRTRCRGRAHQVNPAFFLRGIVFHWHNSCPDNLDAVRPPGIRYFSATLPPIRAALHVLVQMFRSPPPQHLHHSGLVGTPFLLRVSKR
jgi:hypothetical protein